MSTVLSAEEAGAVKKAVVMRVVFPATADLDALPLYIDGGKKGDSLVHRPECIRGRHSVELCSEEWMSFGSYFNAFPASYWAEWTNVKTVYLTVQTKGAGSVLVYRSNASGIVSLVESAEVKGSSTLTFALPLSRFGDGGRYWFDLVAGADPMTLVHSDWSVPEENRRSHGTPSVAMTTMNRPGYCVDALATFARDPQMKTLIDRIYVVDQGTKRVADHDDFADVKASLGEQLELIHQANLGGSGGFSRGMYETVQAGRSEYTLLLDDDILLDTESVTRIVAFANYTKRATIVGGHMFHLNNRSVLQSFGEQIDPHTWEFANSKPHHHRHHDFAAVSYRDCHWMHERIDVGYNGWWMCLIPVDVTKRIGLSMPFFIKWDDSEYSVRAKAHGVSTVSLPGAAVWHMAWTEKDDAVGWESYFHARNRIVTALLHSPYNPHPRLLKSSYMSEVKHNVTMQYFTAQARLLAVRDVLNGPEALRSTISTRIGELRGQLKEFNDGALAPSRDAYPPVHRSKPARPFHSLEGQAPGVVLKAKLAARGVMITGQHFCAPVKESCQANPELVISHRDNKWFNTGRYSSAIVTNAEGSGFWWYRRDPELSRRNIAEATKLYAKLSWNWKKLSREYKAALDEVTSFESWEKIFGITPGSDSK